MTNAQSFPTNAGLSEPLRFAAAGGLAWDDKSENRSTKGESIQRA